MKCILRSLCLLLCVCICSALFSVTACASSVVDGNTVVSSYYIYSKFDKTEFDGSFTLDNPATSLYLVYDVYLSETLERNTTFDFSGYFMFSGGDVSLQSFTMFDDEGTFAGDGLPTFDGSKVELLGAVNSSRACSHIELIFKVDNPVWASSDSTFGYTYYYYSAPSEGGEKMAITGDHFGGQITVMDNGFYLSCNSVTNFIYTYKGAGTFTGVTYKDTLYTSGQSFNIQTVAYGGKNLYVTEDWAGEPVAPVYTYESSCTSVNVTKVNSDGLLSGIIAWLKKIWDTISSLPTRIVDGIVSGIKSLFIPSEEVIISFKQGFENLLSSRFGAVYESIAIIDEFASAIKDADASNTIAFPACTINFGESSFTFGGWDVVIVPQGFEILVEALKLIVSVLATFAFVMGMKKRLEAVLS